MKKNYLFTVLFFVSVLSLHAQDCFKYFPQKKGTVLETTHYDKKDKETGASVLTILDKSVQNGEQRVDVRMENKSPELDSAITSEFAYICKDGKMYVDMSGYLDKQLNAFQGMEVEIEADNLEFPSNFQAGQELPGGTVVATVSNNGMKMATISVAISNRKVEKQEPVKTTAGEFMCFKITQDIESKVGFVKVRGSSAEWIAEDVGVVLSKSYNKKGKLESYSKLTKISQ